MHSGSSCRSSSWRSASSASRRAARWRTSARQAPRAASAFCRRVACATTSRSHGKRIDNFLYALLRDEFLARPADVQRRSRCQDGARIVTRRSRCAERAEQLERGVARDQLLLAGALEEDGELGVVAFALELEHHALAEGGMADAAAAFGAARAGGGQRRQRRRPAVELLDRRGCARSDRLRAGGDVE